MGTGDGKAGGMETKRHLSKMTGIVIYLSIYLFILERKKLCKGRIKANGVQIMTVARIYPSFRPTFPARL